ncbi:RCC1 domain-containing protein [Chondromyces crocatus]|uniref:BNR repeat domain protein n=1 Tax=Chondromyces crocatus TaxID=52 RepID=A0A0K1ECL0_CHOCO|nr:RCC1 domain-containing protein [Chondromyces crocatus]AKT38574.1 uncharacterized protein CMC5_027210 [Chondromyces crocatus]
MSLLRFPPPRARAQLLAPVVMAVAAGTACNTGVNTRGTSSVSPPAQPSVTRVGPPRPASSTSPAPALPVAPEEPAVPLGPARKVSVDGSTACAVLTSGRVACWGALQTGPSDVVLTGTPRLVKGLEEVVDVIVGDLSCARTTSGPVKCWAFGEQARPLAGTEDARDVARTSAGVCVVLSSGAVRCFDMQGRGTDLPALSRVVALSDTSLGRTCAALEDGRVACISQDDDSIGVRLSQKPTLLPGIRNAIDVVNMNQWRVCAITRQGTVQCVASPVAAWTGPSAAQQLFEAHALGPCYRQHQRVGCLSAGGARARDLDLGGAAVDLSCSSSTCCAVLERGEVSCFGSNESGQLGDGNDVNRPDPAPVPRAQGLRKVLAGHQETMALTHDGRLLAWGQRQPIHTPRTFETKVRDLRHALHWLVRTEAEALWLGTPIRGEWLWWKAPAHGKTVRDVSIDVHDTVCIASDDGRVHCAFGTDEDAPRAGKWLPMAGFTDIVALDAHGSTTCGRRKSGELVCFTDTRFEGDVALPHHEPRPVGHVVKSLSPVRAMSLPIVQHTDGQVSELGYPDQQHLTGMPRPELQGFENIAAGDDMSCGLRAGQAFCSGGHNAEGQLGRGHLGRPKTPVDRVASDVALSGFSVGFNHVCALDPAGQAWCWGNDALGQLGRGRRVVSSAPQRVVLLGP